MHLAPLSPLTRLISGALWLTVLLSTIAYPLIAEAGAGRTRGSGNSPLVIALLLPLFLGYTTYKLLMKRYAKRAAAAVLDAAATRDKRWEPSELISHARETFMTLQERWSTNDIKGSLPLLHPSYEAKYTRDLKEHISAGEVNKVWDISISDVELVLARDFEDNDQDLFVAYVSGSMSDAVFRAERRAGPPRDDEREDFCGFERVNQGTGEVEHFEYGTLLRAQGDEKGKTSRRISEYWWFQRKGDAWLLKDIRKDDGAISREVSLDAESISASASSEDDGRQQIRAQEQGERDNQSAHRKVALMAGLVVTALGYLVYFLVLLGGWRLIFG